MKWLKLDCDFRNDPKVRALARQWGGCDAAGFWTLLLAFVGAHGGPECRVRILEGSPIDERYVADWFSLVPRSMHGRLSVVARLGLIDDRAWTEDQTISIPNMLKRVDDYTRKVRSKSGHHPNNVQKVSHAEEEIEEEVDTEEERETNTVAALPRLLENAFESLWQDYPAKDGRKAAERHFSASVKTEQDLTEIRLALSNYKTHLSKNSWKRPKSGATWFNNWRDWVNWIEPEAGGLFGTHSGNSNSNTRAATAAAGKSNVRPYTPKQ